jgi:hypothetical protein
MRPANPEGQMLADGQTLATEDVRSSGLAEPAGWAIVYELAEAVDAYESARKDVHAAPDESQELIWALDAAHSAWRRVLAARAKIPCEKST